MKIQVYSATIRGGARRWYFQCLRQDAAIEGGQRVIPKINGYLTPDEAKVDIEILKAAVGTAEITVIGE